MDPERVCLFASVTRTLAPAVRIGWIVAPRRWISETEIVTEGEPPLFDQLAFAAFLESGDYDRHLRASRLRYRTRRELLADALARQIPDHPASSGGAGLQPLVPLHRVTDAPGVVIEAARREVRVAELGEFRPLASAQAPTLVLGHCNLPDGAIEDAVGRLAAAVRAAAHPPPTS
ncbi:MAG TPA: hypothetical protein VIA06_06035 [Candidatus Dormibacteraeota bacterium]|nr:hypothetical protein [Candidatus Dormibacteraeota bacterium]